MNSETKEEVAIKKIGNAFDNRIDAKRTLLEIKLLTHMDHDNVRSLYSIELYPTDVLITHIYLFETRVYSGGRRHRALLNSRYELATFHYTGKLL